MRLSYMTAGRRLKRLLNPIEVTEEIKQYLTEDGTILDAILYGEKDNALVPELFEELFNENDWGAID
uniref:Uncharacterized protein n=1 Tax=Acrobeloides nanus TaxID=290746 RepID=A0A914DBC4_9BILA